MSIKKYLQYIGIDSQNHSRAEQLEERLRRLEATVYLTDVKGGKELIKRKLSEFRSTIVRMAFPPQQRRQAVALQDFDAEPELRKFLSAALGDRWTFNKQGGRIFFDMTQTLSLKSVTGIQRVVLELGKEASRLGVIPVVIQDNDAMCLESNEDAFRKVQFTQRDTIIFADSSWNYCNKVRRVMKKARRSGARCASLIYDIIPLLLPSVSPPGLSSMFSRWFHLCAIKSDMLICISGSVAREVRDYLHSYSVHEEDMPDICWFHLGGNLQRNVDPDKESIRKKLSLSSAPIFLAVGTIEPRKGHAIALDAMEDVWDSGHDAQFVVVGRYGWSSRPLEDRILDHPEFGKRLRWFDAISDADLIQLYRAARALVCPSIAEGFGLPIVEAATYGLPAIVSDIPVFRETCGDQATFFDVADSDALSDCIVECILSEKRAPDIKSLTWKESARRFVEIVKDQRSERRVGDLESSSNLS